MIYLMNNNLKLFTVKAYLCVKEKRYLAYMYNAECVQ